MTYLFSLYSIHSLSCQEWAMITFIQKYVKEHIPGAKVHMDGWGNLYIIKGFVDNGYPTLACHLDQVHTLHSNDFEVREKDGILYGWSEQNQKREGLGADDKNGIWICLKCLEQSSRLKVFMAVGEEKGCIGSNRADMSFFSDSLYVLEPDCKGNQEIHTNLRGVPCASSEFEEALKAEVNGYSITDGKSTDLLALTLNGIGVSCANIPAGYYQAHKDDEYTVFSELIHAKEYIQSLIDNLTTRYPHVYKTETQIHVEQYLKEKEKTETL